MAKKAASKDDKVLEGLRKAIGGGAVLLQGAKGVGLFAGGKAGQDVANAALADGLIELCPPPVPPTGKKAPPAYARITARGMQRLLENDPLEKSLEGLANAVADLARKFDDQSRQAAARQVPAEVADAMAKLQAAVERTYTGGGEAGQLQNARETLAAVQQMLGRVRRPEPEPVASQSSSRPPEIDDEIVRLVAAAKAANAFARPTLADLYAKLSETHPGLGFGLFHDRLRILHDSNRIRMFPFTGPLATLPDPRAALYHNREVMYYVERV